MMPEDIDPGSLRPQELEAVYDISREVAKSIDIETTLDEIISLARPVFIFDNMVLYLRREEGPLEPIYARAIGRGRFHEADLAWGEATANETYQTMQVVIRTEQLASEDEDRTNIRYLLGIPLKLADQVKGVLVFIRFGGPIFLPDQIHLAEYISVNVAQLLEHRQLVKRIASLEAQRRLDALQEEFISMITHELLTPLGFIKGYATTLLREDTRWEEDTRREFLTIIDEEADRLRELIDNLLDSSRLQAGTLDIDLQPLRLDTFLKDILLRANTRFEGLTVNLHIETAGLQTQADPTRLAQVFDNLISNATKYAPGSPIDITLDKLGSTARISVRDQGPGISPEHIHNLFKRFYRVPGNTSAVRGTGLGLYICNQIIQAHRGEIIVDSKLGHGTVFYILLPC